MSIRNLWIFLFLVSYIALFFLHAKSQQQYDVAYRFEYDTIAISPSRTFANRLLITNHSRQPITLKAEANRTPALSGMIRLPELLYLNANETKSFPLKYMADRHTITQAIQPFSIALKSEDSARTVQPARSFYTRLDVRQSLLLQTPQTEYYIDESTGQVQFVVRVANIGLVPLVFQLRFPNVPPGIEITGDTQLATLAAGAQLVLTYSVKMRVKKIAADAELSIQAVRQDGAVLAANNIRILTVGSVKRFGTDMFVQEQSYDNMVALRYLHMGEHANIYQVQGFGKIDHAQGNRLNYKVNLDYFSDQRQLYIYDSYVDYQAGDWGLRLGNIYENLDQFINGRGIKASYSFDQSRSLTLYAVQNQYMLLNQINNFYQDGEVFGAKYVFQYDKNQENSLTYLYSRDRYRAVQSHLISGKGYTGLADNQNLSWEGGTSLEQTAGGQNKMALAAGINYSGTFQNYQISSVNYYSSPYYAGLRRGLLQSDSRLLMSIGDKRRLAARVSYMDNDPGYVNNDRNYFLNSGNRIQQYELGYYGMLGQLHFNLRPYLMMQHSRYRNWLSTANELINWKSNSLRTAVDINFFSPKHRFSVQTDYGYTYKNTSERPIAPFHSVRVIGNYNNTLFGIDAFVQINPYYLSDLLAVRDNSSYSIFSFGPNTRFEVFNQSLQVQLSTMYSYYGFSKSKNFSINGSARWRMAAGWTLAADLFYTYIQGQPLFFADLSAAMDHPGPSRYAIDNRQIRLGIEKSFGRPAGSKGFKLQVTCFEDQNNNGLKEKGEDQAASILVRIGKEVVITDEKGRAEFVGVQPGSYTIQVENSQGWVAQGAVTVVITKNKAIEIPLTKTKKLTGKLQLASNKYMTARPDLSGISIYAVDRNGRKYNTLTNDEGEYIFYLPVGVYTINVVTDGMPFGIENAGCQVEVEAHRKTELPVLKYWDQRRRVNIKRF